MRVLLLTLYFAPDVAANAVIMTGLAEELSALGHRVTVVTAFPHYAGNVIPRRYRGRIVQRDWHGDVRVFRTYLYTSPRKERFLVRVLNYASFHLLSTLAGLFTGPQDVILAPSPPPTIGLSAHVLGRLKRVPYVYNVQDVYPDVAVRLRVLTNPRLIAFSEALQRFIYDSARAVTVVSEGLCRSLLGKGVPADKVEVIPNFVDTDFVRPLSRHNCLSREQRVDNRRVVLFAGNVGLSQGLESVLEAARLLADRPDVLFLIVGNGAAKSGLVQQARAMALENVRFLPFLPRERVPELYATADLCLVPLRRGISFDSVPSKAYTIMAAARPVVASVDEGSDTQRLLEAAGCGLCVEPEDPAALAEAILTLCRDPDLCARLGRNGRAYVETRHTPRVVASQYAGLFGRIAG